MKIKLLSLLLVLVVLLLCSCGKEDDGKKKYDTVYLNVYNWGQYISNEDDEESGLFDVNEAFEKYFNENLADKYGFYVKVNYSTYENNESMYSKLSTSAVAYDVIVPSDYMIQKMIDENRLMPLDYSILTNYGNINEDFKNAYYDPENKYSVPYTYGMVGIIYNSEFIKEEEEPDVQNESWALLWNKKYAGKILQFNNPRDAFASAMFYAEVANGKAIDINSHNYADWDEALGLLKEQKSILQAYVNDEIFNKMKGASAYAAAYYAGDFLTMAAGNSDLRFYYPKEGTNYFVDAFCIPKNDGKDENSPNYKAANEYINYMIGREAATANALYIGYASPNKAVVEYDHYINKLDFNYSIYDGDEEDAECIIDAYEVLYGKTMAEAKAKAYEKYFVDKEKEIDVQVYVNELWESLKTENSTEPWIHVTSITIVIGVVSLTIYDQYIKKKRSQHYRLRDKAKKV